MLPDEIWADILNYLDPPDLVSSQLVSQRLLKLARDSSLWRNKVFEKAPSAAYSRANDPSTLIALTGALGGLSLGNPLHVQNSNSRATSSSKHQTRLSSRAKAVLEWDKTHPDETIDWYSEYVARNAPLSTVWADHGASKHGIALLGSTEKVLAPIEDGSLGIWDIRSVERGRRQFVQTAKSRRGLLFEDMLDLGQSSSKKSKHLGANAELISVDSARRKAFIAVENILNEVDLDRMEIVSQHKFCWPITALSQEGDVNCDLTVGTSFSLHIHDTRLSVPDFGDGAARLNPADESRIAFLQNYAKGPVLASYSPSYLDRAGCTNRLESFAKIEPGPQSIIHRGENEIVIAGRLPSIVFYDRRHFPTPTTAIHSGARLSAMTIIPRPPAAAANGSSGDSTLIACGEYGGRGSLELYELSWNKGSFRSAHTDFEDEILLPPSRRPFSFKNRQEASSSKLLSVATQGARIVFSDSEGMLKWVERDGRGLARRWNINTFQLNEHGASITGDKVVRKMIVLPEPGSERGTTGDSDILVWTGENMGIVTTKPKPWDDHEELVKAFERGMDLNDRAESEQDVREVEYSTRMRRALERQADERRWMSRLGGRR